MKKYTNKQLQEICQAQHIHNDHNFSSGEVYIGYVPGEQGRASRSPYWRLCKPGATLSEIFGKEDTLEFGVWNRGEKAIKLATAMQWAKEKFGITKWARGPFGAYYDKAFCEKRLAEIISKHERKLNQAIREGKA